MSKMPTTQSKQRTKRKQHRKALHRIISRDFVSRMNDDEYREEAKRVYGGPKGALLTVASTLSLHIPMGERLFRKRKFDLRGVRSALDVGSGAGQLAQHLLKYGDPEIKVTCTDLLQPMLCRARSRLDSSTPDFVAADLAKLPFADGSFDCVTCGYVLEHLPDPVPGLKEMARVLQPGGRMFLLVTEDTFSGAWTSRLWSCRTHNRQELLNICKDLGLVLKQEIWFTRLHKVFRAGGICVEIVKS